MLKGGHNRFWGCFYAVAWSFKPIFHQNAKYLALGVGFGQCTRRQNFALPNAKYTNMLVYFAFFCVTRRQTPDAKLKFALAPTPTPNASQWNIGCVGSLALGLCVGHVHFIFFVLISFASDTRRKPVFQWNMGFSHIVGGAQKVSTL